MAILRCKACGAELRVEKGQTIVECNYCLLQQTVPKIDDEFKVQLFNRANELRRRFEFDAAENCYQTVISINPEEAEAYWGICLCKYGIMYVEDQSTGLQIPTFYRMLSQSILNDINYEKACQYSGAAAWKYSEEAEKIDKLQKKIVELSNTEEPYEIFICYKKTDLDNGERTKDSHKASEIYTRLIEKGYKVFWAERSLPAGCEYEPYIYSALSTAKIMLVLASDSRYIEATWVKNEWLRFRDMMNNNKDKTLITCYANMTAEEIPPELNLLQALDMNSFGFLSDVLEQIQRKIPPKKRGGDELEDIKKTLASMQFSSKSGDNVRIENGVYDGASLNGIPHGTGTAYYSNGAKYEGEWNAGKWNGSGTLYYEDGNRCSKYEGYWRIGKMHGDGTLYYSDGESWSGEWSGGNPRNGSGKFYRVENNCCIGYEGSLQNGLLNGEGKILFYDAKEKNGFCLSEGYFENGKLNGKGITYQRSGEKCEGEFRNGRPWNADGKFQIPDLKCSFNGNWRNGDPNGNGIVTFENGDVVEGVFESGLSGEVVWRFNRGQQYKGTIQNGRLTGHGKLYASDGFCSYDGDFNDGKMHGSGIRYMRNGERYVGGFLNDKYHGQGTLYMRQGTWSGEWQNGNRWRGKGIIIFYDDKGKPTGQFYNGYVVEGKAAGKGIMRYPDGTRFDGEFLNDAYYNGVIYNAKNEVSDKVVNGKSEKQKDAEDSARRWGRAANIFNIISKIGGN